MPKAIDRTTRVTRQAATPDRLPDTDIPFPTIMEGIEKIKELEDHTFDLSRLIMSVGSVFEKIEHSEGVAPHSRYCRMIYPGDVEALSYLIERCHDIADDLNSKFHNYVHRLPMEKMERADAKI